MKHNADTGEVILNESERNAANVADDALDGVRGLPFAIMALIRVTISKHGLQITTAELESALGGIDDSLHDLFSDEWVRLMGISMNASLLAKIPSLFDTSGRIVHGTGFVPQPTRGNAPTNPATLGQKAEE